MEKYGTDYGGWYFPIESQLNENSIIYSAGVGEDISFDLKMQELTHGHIFLIDPTAKALKHYNECKLFFDSNKTTFGFSGNIQKDYLPYIRELKPNFEKIHYVNVGLWNTKDSLKFYKQENPNYVSQSLISNMFGNDYDIVEVDTIKNIMNHYNHTSIDVLKLDIEGAENKVLSNMLEDKIYPKILCIEFDLKLKNKDTDNSTINIINNLNKHGYIIMKNDNWNITFQRF